MPIRSNKFVISLNHPRSFGGFDDLTSEADMRTWKGIAHYFSDITESVPGFGCILINIDWTPAIEYCERIYDFFHRSEKERLEILQRDHNFFDFDIACEATVSFDEPPDPFQFWRGDDVLRHILYNVFLIGNLTTPGSVNYYRSHIRAKGAPSEYSPMAVTDLELSEYIFEDSWHEAQNEPWAKVDFLDFGTVLQWHRKLDIGFSQVARTKMQKLLFALLHITRNSIEKPETTIWIAGLLEDLFDTKTGASFQQLCSRLSLFLNFDEKEQGTVKKRLRNFFDLRHGFAHGGAPIYHPIGNELWDSQMNDRYKALQVPNSFAATLVISVAQEIIRRGLVDFRYEESFVEVKGE